MCGCEEVAHDWLCLLLHQLQHQQKPCVPTKIKNFTNYSVMIAPKNDIIRLNNCASLHHHKNTHFIFFFYTKTPDSKSSSTLMVVLFFAKRLALMAAIFSTDIASLKDLQINIRGKNWIKLRNQLFMTLGTNLRLMKGKSTLAMAFREYNFEVCIFPPGQ